MNSTAVTGYRAQVRPNNYNFKPIQKLKLSGVPEMPENIFRLSRASYSISPNLFKHFGVSYTTKGGARHAKVAFEFDRINLAVRIFPSDEGFSALVDDNNRLTGAIPTQLKRSGMPLGDYELVDDKNLVFVLR